MFEKHIMEMELGSSIDTDLRHKRTEVYKELWKSTELLPKWPRASDVTYKDLIKFSNDLKDWYFNKGGIYLSRGAQNRYADLQKTLTYVLMGKDLGKISNQDYDRVRNKCSALRTELTNDLLSRRGAPLKRKD